MSPERAPCSAARRAEDVNQRIRALIEAAEGPLSAHERSEYETLLAEWVTTQQR